MWNGDSRNRATGSRLLGSLGSPALSLMLAAALLSGCEPKSETPDSGKTPAPVAPKTEPVRPESAKPPVKENEPVSPPAAATPPAETKPAKESAMPRVRVKTTLGDFVIELDKEKAPITVENFLTYVNDGFFKQTIVHRVVPGFVVQAGGYDADFQQKPTRPPIKNEWRNGLKNLRGTLSMARTSDADSATSQFFINLVDNDALDMARPQTGNAAYAVFGRVVEGWDVIEKIVAAPRRMNPSTQMEFPDPMVILQATTVE